MSVELGPLIRFSVFTMSTLFMLTIGIGITAQDVLNVLKERQFVGRLILINLILVPLLGILIIRLFHLIGDTRLALMLLAIAPGGIQTLQFTSKIEGERILAASVFFILSLLAILVMPILGRWILPVETDIPFPFLKVSFLLLLYLLIPLFAGLAIQYVAPDWAQKLKKPLLNGAYLSFILMTILTMAVKKQSAGLVGGKTLLAMCLFILGAMALGWCFGGTTPERRQIVAVASSMRNGALGLIIAGNLFPTRGISTAIIAFLLLMVPINLIFTLYQNRKHQHRFYQG